MAPVNCIKFSYLGTNRIVLCDLNTDYEKIQIHVAKAFGIVQEIAPAIQFNDGRGYLFNKELFEYFLILFPQPEQKFFVRLDCNKIIECRQTHTKEKSMPLRIESNNKNKRNHREIVGDDDEEEEVVATPVRRQNCFYGSLPSDETEVVITEPQPKKRLRLSKSVKKSMWKIIKPPQPKRAFRL